jgi:hypothetical protein
LSAALPSASAAASLAYPSPFVYDLVDFGREVLAQLTIPAARSELVVVLVVVVLVLVLVLVVAVVVVMAVVVSSSGQLKLEVIQLVVVVSSTG